MSFLMNVQSVLPDPLFTPDVIGRDPFILFLVDLRSALQIILPGIFRTVLPLRRPSSLFADITLTGLLFQIFLTAYSVFLTVPLILLGLLVGGASPIAAAFLLSYPFNLIQGAPLVHVEERKSPVRALIKQIQGSLKNMTNDVKPPANVDYYSREYNGEAWFFINGIATSRSGITLDLIRLEQLFKRPVTGILNRSLGPLMDVLECVVQRCFSINTRDVRFGYKEVRAALEAKNVDKVVLICHSQGGIITSLIVDLLLSTVSRTHLTNKLEVYTFADASNHFSNPLNILNQPTIRYVEHYANALDPVSQFGVLKFVIEQQKGKVANGTPKASNILNNKGISVMQLDDNEHLLMQQGVPNSEANGNGFYGKKTRSGSTAKKDGQASLLNGIDAVGVQDNDDSSFDKSRNNGIDLPRQRSAAGQFFSGTLFVRGHTSGHLLVNH